MRICASCGRENPNGTDFCACGEYLRWEPTNYLPAVAAPAASASDASALAPGQASVADERHQAAPPELDPNITLAADAVAPSAGGWAGAGAPPAFASQAAGAAPPGAAALMLRLPDDSGASEGVVSLTVLPGARVTMLGLIRNQADVVDNFDLAIRGLPEDWWTIAPATAYLVPYGTGGTFEQEFQIHIHPPRTPQAQARAWSFEVVAASRAYGGEVASAPASVTIGAYFELATELRPERASGRLKARYRLVVRNRANARTEVALSAEDTDAECTFRFAEPSIKLEPGNAIECPFTVFPPRQIWVGRPHERRFQVTAAPVGVDQPQPPRVATFRQRSWLPWWLTIVVPIAVALAVLAVKLSPKQTVVPKITGQPTVWAAEKLLTKAGFRIMQKPGAVPSASQPVGSIADQNPAPGAKAKKGAVVTVEVYGRQGGSKTVNVPGVVGDQAAVGIQKLIAFGLSAGTVSPQPPNPNAIVRSQYPFAGTPEAKGTPVNLFLTPAASASSSKGSTKSHLAGAVTPAAAAATAAAAGAAAAAVAANGVATPAAVHAAAAEAGKGAIAVPTLPADPSAAGTQLSQLGLVPQPLKQPATVPVGDVAGSVPAAGAKVAKGATIDLLISSGSPQSPQLAYDDGHNVHVIDPATRKAPMQVPAGATEASWSPGGSHLVYSLNGELWVLAADSKNARPSPLDQPPSGLADRNPSFVPQLTAQTITVAFIQRAANQPGTASSNAQDTKLCFVALRTTATSRSCTAAPGWALGGQVNWSPNGTTILVLGIRNPGDEFGLLAFTSSVPFSSQASNWGQPTLQTDATVPGRGVFAGAFSPDKRHMALVSNIGASNIDDFEVYITPFGNYKPAAATGPLVSGCQISWRADSQELAVMQPDGLCGASATGQIVGVQLSNPRNQTVLAPAPAAHPDWQPVSTGG
jgi:beta-lactam-binding protein with PASTA domain